MDLQWLTQVRIHVNRGHCAGAELPADANSRPHAPAWGISGPLERESWG